MRPKSIVLVLTAAIVAGAVCYSSFRCYRDAKKKSINNRRLAIATICKQAREQMLLMPDLWNFLRQTFEQDKRLLVRAEVLAEIVDLVLEKHIEAETVASWLTIQKLSARTEDEKLLEELIDSTLVRIRGRKTELPTRKTVTIE